MIIFYVPLAISTFSFDSTLSVNQINDNNFVELIYGEERYAVHVGRIEKISPEPGSRTRQQIVVTRPGLP